MKTNELKIFWIDLFSGAGGTTSGIEQSDYNSHVIACVNHDEWAIKSHKKNHPGCFHFNEDIRDMQVVDRLGKIAKRIRSIYPNCIINIWASLECTNYSKAKGGQPRDADSRTLANFLPHYVKAINPNGLFIENVREFMAWGPLDNDGKPVSLKKGIDYLKWIQSIKAFGYEYDWKLMNSANFGAYTSRERYFGQFQKKGTPISWPVETHSKKPNKSGELFGESLKPWKAVKDVLDLKDHGVSIFERNKPLSDNTLKRILAGLEKFVAKGEETFIKRYNGGDPKEKVKSIELPNGSISTTNRHAVVKCIFLSSYYGNGRAHSTNEPCNTLTTKDRYSIIEAVSQFMDNQYTNSVPQKIQNPSSCITTVPKQNLITVLPWIMDTNFNNVGSSIDQPSRVILANRKQHYLMNPQFSSKGCSVEKPGPTIIARQDKKPLHIVTTEAGKKFTGIIVYKSDSETMIKIKEFMAAYGIVDIKMRMLKISELLKIQGFPNDYTLLGTKTLQKKFIGNSVVPKMAKVIADANYEAMDNFHQFQKAI